MKSALILVLSPLFAIGVFGVNEMKSVSVMEGESVTLQTGVKVQGSDEIEWWLNETLIFRISSLPSEIKVLDNTAGDRLKVDKQTGDLKFTNIKTADSGQYMLKIISTKGSSDEMFVVSVVPDPGLSSGAIAGIVIAVLAAVAAAVGGIYYGYGKKGQML